MNFNTATDIPQEVPTEPGEHRLLCTQCDKGHRDDALAVKVDQDGSFTWMCHRCDWTGAHRPSSTSAELPPGQDRWDRARLCTEHPYLANKAVKAHGLRVDDRDVLFVPMRGVDGAWKGLQTIRQDGTKRYCRGTKKVGSMHVIGEIRDDTETICVAEGYATAATVHAAMDLPVVVAFDAGNLRPVAEAIRERYPGIGIVIAADDDRDNPKNPGRRKGASAAGVVNGCVAFPDFSDDEPGSDFNDLAKLHGIDRVKACLDAATAPPDPEEIVRETVDAFDPEQAVIVVANGALVRLVEQSAAALRACGVEIYQRGGQLVRPLRLESDASEGGISRAAGAVTLRPVDPAWMQLRLANSAAWQRFDRKRKELVDTDPPMHLARTLAEVPDAAKWPVLHAIARHPVLTPDGQWIGTPGYHNGILIDIAGTWPEPGVTRADAEAALAMIRHHVRHFRWATPQDESAAISMFLTAVLRVALDTAPMHGVDAPVMGSGKSLIIDSAAILATGTAAAVMDYARDPNEADKRLDGMLLAGDALIAIDNIERALEGSTLCQTITQISRRVRPLGSSSMVTVPCTAMITATGNNLVLRGDIVRRAIVARIDPGVANPELRNIDQDLLAETRERRRELVAAAQTIVRAYLRAGRPVSLPGFGSFEQWSRSVRAALVWLGLPDPTSVQERTRNADPERESLLAVLTAWHITFGSDPMTVAKVIANAGHDTALHDALSLVALRRGSLDPRVLGNWLSNNRDKWAGSLMISRHTGGHAGTARWSVSGGYGGSGGSSYANTRVNEEECTHCTHTNAFEEEVGEELPPDPPDPPSSESSSKCPRCDGEGCPWCD